MRGDEPILQAERTGGAMGPFGSHFMTPLVLGALLNPINSSVVATALTAVAHEFPRDAGQVAWLISSLYLAGAIAQPVLGRIADLFGPRRILLFGMVVTGLGGVVGALAPSIAWLVFSRVLIGIGSSAGYPCAMAMVRRRAQDFDIPTPPKILAILSAAGTATATLGPALGGFIVSGLGWRWVFAVNLPLAIVGLVMVLRRLPADPPARRFEIKALDLPGMALFSGTVICLMMFLMGLKDAVEWPLLAAGGVLGGLTVAAELRREGPFIDVRMVAGNAGLRRLYMRHILILALMYAFFFAIPQWMQSARHYSSGMAGVLLLPYGVATVGASFSVTRAGKLGLAKVLGGLSMLGGCAMLFWMTADSPLISLLLMTVLFGAAGGAVLIVNQQALVQHAPAANIGAAAGLLRTCQYVGAMSATPLAAYVLQNHANDRSIHVMSMVMLPLALFVLVLLVIDGRRPLAATAPA